MNEWMNDGNNGMVMTITIDKVSLTLIPQGMPKNFVWQSETDDTLVQSANFMFSGESTSPSSLHANGKIRTENKIKCKKIKN